MLLYSCLLTLPVPPLLMTLGRQFLRWAQVENNTYWRPGLSRCEKLSDPGRRETLDESPMQQVPVPTLFKFIRCLREVDATDCGETATAGGAILLFLFLSQSGYGSDTAVIINYYLFCFFMHALLFQFQVPVRIKWYFVEWLLREWSVHKTHHIRKPD